MSSRSNEAFGASLPEPELSPDDVLHHAVEALSRDGDDALARARAGGLPDREEVIEWCRRIKSLLLHQRDRFALRSELPALSERLAKLIAAAGHERGSSVDAVVAAFLGRLAPVRALLCEDLEAAYDGDPAARDHSEILMAYPSLQAVAIYRLAHELYRLGVRLIPRVMTEYAHSKYGIDIHPGATIGRRFFIDHGTGVVVGETCEIGNCVKVYQGVTLGALSLPRDEDGQVIRGQKRHPTIEDDVTIYAGATILGGGTVIGRGSVVGGNVWLTESCPPFTRVQIKPPAQLVRQDESASEQERVCELHWDI